MERAVTDERDPTVLVKEPYTLQNPDALDPYVQPSNISRQVIAHHQEAVDQGEQHELLRAKIIQILAKAHEPRTAEQQSSCEAPAGCCKALVGPC